MDGPGDDALPRDHWALDSDVIPCPARDYDRDGAWFDDGVIGGWPLHEPALPRASRRADSSGGITTFP